MNIGDITHVKKQGEGHWIGKVVSVTGDTANKELITIHGVGNPGHATMYTKNMTCIDGEWWER